MEPVININNIGKCYQISTLEKQDSLRDLLSHPQNLFQRKKALSNGDFWALRNVTFDVNQGDRIGIIGRNGAGKSTLLKVLSRITEPTEGRVLLKGKVASLLEVGTGFHSELTGRENIFLNGAILGMTKKEIISKFDAIVDFSGVEKFLETPVKRYSSGMYVRLAFAIAAHLEPEILIVDEVLAVGDVEFQKKCLGKMQEVSKQGRTILFVSHNMNAVEQLCNKAVLLESGKLNHQSEDVRGVIKKYLFQGAEDVANSEWVNTNEEYVNDIYKPLRIRVVDASSELLLMPISNIEDAWLEIKFDLFDLDPAFTIGYAIYSDDGSLLFWTNTTDVSENRWLSFHKGINVIRTKLPKRFLNEGEYRIELMSSLHFRKWLSRPGVNSPGVSISIQGGLSDSPYWIAKRPGYLAPVIEWEKVE